MDPSVLFASISTDSSPSSAISNSATWTSEARRATAVLTIDRDAIVANWRLLADRVAPADCAAVVKADAYGLGAGAIAPVLRDAGCLSFVTATVDEALALRADLPAADIYELGGLPPGAGVDLARAGVIPVLNHLGEIEAARTLCRRLQRRMPVAIHIDTGMNRLGLGIDDVVTLLDEPERLDGLFIRMWISHLARADEPVAMNLQQLGRFVGALNYLPEAPASLAASSGIFLGSGYHFDMVRPGAALYGINPTPEAANPMRPAVRLDARVLQVRTADAPGSVGYGATHRLSGRTRLATLGIGYADGYFRALGGKGAVHFNGVPAPVAGRVSMDLLSVDVTNVPDHLVQPGAFAEVIGPHRPVDTVAAEAGTIGYEVLTALGRRHYRLYTGGAAS